MPNKQFNKDIPPRRTFCAKLHKTHATTVCLLIERYVDIMRKIILIIWFCLMSHTALSCESYSGRWEVGDHYYWNVQQTACSNLKIEIVVSGEVSEIQNYRIDDKWYCDKYSSNYNHATCLKARWENPSIQKNIILTLARYESEEGGLLVSDTYLNNQEKLEVSSMYEGGETWAKSWLRKTHNK